MRLLLDQNLSVRLASLLAEASGWEASHVRDLGLAAAPDNLVLAAAAEQNRVLVSADTDFGTLLAATGEPGPSVVLLRIASGRTAEAIAGLLLANLPRLEPDLQSGALVVITDQRVRVRRLPIT